MISFGDFRLDRRTRRLRHRGRERPLRAKSSAVLLYLAEHPGRLVTHDELLRAVWRGTSVSQTVLRVCIREIRAALGDDADRYLTTVPRRGYRFAIEPGQSQSSAAAFTGRDAERAVLHEALARAGEGRRRVVLITGEAGAGKTALVERFLDDLRADGVRCGSGQAPELRAGAEGLAAVLDLLGRLCDEAGGEAVVQALARWAPGWLRQMPGRIEEGAVDDLRARSANPSWEGRLLELGEAVESLAAEMPLVLVLEDLQWSDPSTLDALAYLTRRTVPARLLLIGTCRTGALPAGHPFLALQERLRAAGISAEIELDAHPLAGAEAPVARRRAPRPAADAAGDVRRAAERRQLTVLSCDLVDAAALAQRLDPEELRSVVRAFQETASEVIERFGGHVAQYLLDGLLAYFSYPHAHEDDAERAVRAGLEVLAALELLNDTLEPEHRVRLAVRIGIHTGPVVVGEMGAGTSAGMIALGDVPHVASRVQAAAAPDTVLITDATRSLVGGAFVIEGHGAQTLDGDDGSPRLHRVVRASGRRGRLATATRGLTPFVGRAAELATLVERWERARRGDGQAVLIAGDAGIGKSRLALQLRQHTSAVPHAWIESGATPYTQGTPFHPVIGLVTQALGITAEEGSGARLAKIERGLGRLATPEAIALIADLAGLPVPTALEMSPELQRRKSIELLLDWTISVSAAQPSVLLIEDLHWCDPSTLELLGRLVARVATAPLLVLLTARPEFTAPWAAATTTLALARLGERESQDMVTALVGDALPVRTVELLIARSDGVPLFVEELTRSVAESGQARDPDAIPMTLADSLMGRLDRLAAAKEVAQRASVLGREFSYALLAEVTTLGDVELCRELERLVDAEVVLARGEPPEATYAFRHALLQQAAYESLLKRTREALHGAACDALLRSFPERVAAEPAVIARHAERAGRVGDAIAFYRRAGERERRRFAHEEGIHALRRALDLLATQPEDDTRDASEVEIQLALASSLATARGLSHPETATAYERARVLCERRGDERNLCLASIGLAIVSFARGDVEQGRVLAAGVREPAERAGDDELALLARLQVAIPEHFQGKLASALSHLEACRALYRPERHHGVTSILFTDPGVSTLAFMAATLTGLGWPDQGLARAREGVALARRLGNPSSLVHALVFESAVHWARRDTAAQLASAAEAIAVAEPQGLPYFVGLARTFHAAARVASGEASAIADVRAGMELAAGAGDLGGAPASFVLLAEAQLAAGQPDDALGAVEMGLALSAQTGQPFWDAELHRLRGELWLLPSAGKRTRAHAEKRAEECFREALAIAVAQGTKQSELLAATSLARLCQRRGRPAAGRRLLEPVVEWFTEGFATGDLIAARALLAQLR